MEVLKEPGKKKVETEKSGHCFTNVPFVPSQYGGTGPCSVLLDLPRAVAADELRLEEAHPPISLDLGLLWRLSFPLTNTDTNREHLDHLDQDQSLVM